MRSRHEQLFAPPRPRVVLFFTRRSEGGEVREGGGDFQSGPCTLSPSFLRFFVLHCIFNAKKRRSEEQQSEDGQDVRGRGFVVARATTSPFPYLSCTS